MQVPKHFTARVAGKVFADTPDVLVYEGETLLRLWRDDSGYLCVDLDVFDANGEPKATIRSCNIVDTDGTVTLQQTEQAIRVVDRGTNRIICDIGRRMAANAANIDIALLLHAPDGFLIHANTAQTNLRSRSASTGFGKH